VRKRRGFRKDVAISKHFASHTKIGTIYEGTSFMQLGAIAKSVL